MMLVSLYTSRVVLQALGEVNFGVYNIVGGVIVLFTFINSSMSAATQRYLMSSLEGENGKSVTEVFSQALLAHIFIAVAIIILGETIGLWFVTNKLNIPEGRENAALWVYQLSILTAVLGIIRCPYNASIIAYEEMSFFAWVSVIESILKLGVAFIILCSSIDKLIVYASLLSVISIIVALMYYIFCIKKFPAIRFRYKRDTRLLKEMILFSVWSLLGNASNVGVSQGSALIMNIFYGVVINAALGIANQVNAVASAFVSNFQTAFMPQVTKSYVSGDMNYLNNLILNASRYSVLLMFLVSFPIYFNCEYVLKLWLGIVPPDTPGLVKIVIICLLFDALSGPLWMLALAMGNIRKYQIYVSLISLSNLILMYIAAKMHFTPVLVFSTRAIILCALYVYRRVYIDKAINIDATKWIKSVYGRIVILVSIAGIFAWLSSQMSLSFIRTIVDCIIGLLLVFFIGLESSERKKIIAMAKVRIQNIY